MLCSVVYVLASTEMREGCDLKWWEWNDALNVVVAAGFRCCCRPRGHTNSRSAPPKKKKINHLVLVFGVSCAVTVLVVFNYPPQDSGTLPMHHVFTQRYRSVFRFCRTRIPRKCSGNTKWKVHKRNIRDAVTHGKLVQDSAGIILTTLFHTCVYFIATWTQTVKFRFYVFILFLFRNFFEK